MKRRDFLTRAGLVLGSVGIAENFKLDLMHKIGRTILPEAGAAAAMPPQRVLEICFREGIPLIQFATGNEFATLSGAQFANFPYSSSQITKNASNLYLNSNSASLAPHAANIAITQGIESDGGHTNLFNIRKGSTGQNLTTPIVELAEANTTNSLIYGVKWPGDALNQTNNFKDLVQLGGAADFTKLFKNSRLQMTNPELGTVLDAAAKLSLKQSALLESKLQDSATQYKVHNGAVQLFTADYSALLDTSSMAHGLSSADSVMVPPGCCTPGTANYADTRKAVGLTMRGFQHNLVNSSMVVIDLGDWHPLQGSSSTGPITKAIADTLAAAIDFMKITPDPASTTGQMLWDTTLIMATSEFNRGISRLGADNNDGDTQGVMLIGKKINGNYYGSFDLSGSGKGTAYGFDIKTGAPTVGQKNSTLQAHYTIRKALGLPLQITEGQQAMNVMLKTS